MVARPFATGGKRRAACAVEATERSHATCPRSTNAQAFRRDTTKTSCSCARHGLNSHRAWGLGSWGHRRVCRRESDAPVQEATVGIGPDGGASRVTTDVRDWSRPGKAHPTEPAQVGEMGRHRDAKRVTGVEAERFFSRGCIGSDRSKRMRVTAHHLPVLRRANGGALVEPSRW
jgi:hypothetical protein